MLQIIKTKKSQTVNSAGTEDMGQLFLTPRSRHKKDKEAWKIELK